MPWFLKPFKLSHPRSAAVGVRGSLDFSHHKIFETSYDTYDIHISLIEVAGICIWNRRGCPMQLIAMAVKMLL